MKFITLLLDCASISLQLRSTFFTAMILCFQLSKFSSVYCDYCYGKFFSSAGAGNGLQLPRATVLIRIYLFSNKIFCFLGALIQAEILHIRYTHCQSISSHIFLSLLPIYDGFLLLLLSTLWLTHCSTNSEHMSCFLITKDSFMKYVNLEKNRNVHIQIL